MKIGEIVEAKEKDIYDFITEKYFAYRTSMFGD
jgi:hypothetical protein